MDGCKNYGSVTTGNNSAGYACLGGMVGKTLDGMLTIKNCENHGPVAIVGTRNNNDTSAGGIIGLSAHQTNLDNNLNTAAITASVTKVKVGGIWGFDYVRDATKYTVAGTVKNCTNKGEVKATATTMSVGGLFGIISKTSVENGTNTNYGNVTCVGGALAGSSSITWSGLVGTSVTVNGEAGAETTPAAAWLCPSGNVTGSYVTEQ